MPLELVLSDGAIAALPCPFCGSPDIALDCSADDGVSVEEGDDAWLHCETCLTCGPIATIGCRDEEDGVDLEREAYELWNKRVGCAMGLECPEHNGSVHGAEAEELRSGFETLAEKFDGVEHDGEDIGASIRAVLDIDARDSLSYLEKAKRSGAK